MAEGYAYVDQYGIPHVVSDLATAQQFAQQGTNVYSYSGNYSGGYATDAGGGRVNLSLPGSIGYPNEPGASTTSAGIGNIVASNVQSGREYTPVSYYAGNYNQQQYPQYGNYQVANNSDLIRQMYQEQLNASLAQLKAAIASSKSKYESETEKAPQTYSKLREAVSTNYYQSLPALREALANTGDLYGGMSRQELLNAQTAMQNDINSLNLQQQNYIDSIKRAIADLENSGSLQEAQLASENASRLMEALIGESNRVEQQSYQRLQDALARSDKAAAQSYSQAQDLAAALGYVNPWAQYTLTPEIMQLLAPYADDYAAFIQANPTSWLVPYAQNARFQKMLSDPGKYAVGLEPYRTLDYQTRQLQNALTQAQIESTQALANQRNTPKTTTVKEQTQTEITNYWIASAIKEMSKLGTLQERNNWLWNHQAEIIQNAGPGAYQYLLSWLYPKEE